MRFAGLLIPALLFGCGKSNASNEFPAATDWSTDDVTAGAGNAKPKGAANADPHASADPHANIGQEQGDDEEEQGGEEGGESDDPHKGIVGAPPINGTRTAPDNVAKLGLQAPDPDRVIDPNKRIRGVIKLDPKIASKLSPGVTVFLIVRRPGADGQPTGSPIAVDKLTWTGPGQGFELTEGKAMVAGTEFTGDVIVQARFDHDGDAGTKQPGDIVGMERVRIPADGVVIELETILP